MQHPARAAAGAGAAQEAHQLLLIMLIFTASPIQATLLIRREVGARDRLLRRAPQRAGTDTIKIVEKGKRAVVTGMSLMLCISGRTHCILNRYCFVFRACAQNAALAPRLASFFTVRRHSPRMLYK